MISRFSTPSFRSRRLLWALAALGAGVLGLASACGGGGGGYSSAPPPPANTVRVGTSDGYGGTNNVFSPATLTVKVGDTVTWTWQGGGHTVDSGSGCGPDGKFSSGGVQSAGYSFSHTFSAAGTYPYYCTTHCGQSMTGTIVVQ